LGAEFRSLNSLKFGYLAYPDGGGSVIVELLVVSLDLANLLVEQDLVRQLVVNDLLVDLRDAIGTERGGGRRPAKG
jgi:hypothetical protein